MALELVLREFCYEKKKVVLQVIEKQCQWNSSLRTKWSNPGYEGEEIYTYNLKHLFEYQKKEVSLSFIFYQSNLAFLPNFTIIQEFIIFRFPKCSIKLNSSKNMEILSKKK